MQKDKIILANLALILIIIIGIVFVLVTFANAQEAALPEQFKTVDEVNKLTPEQIPQLTPKHIEFIKANWKSVDPGVKEQLFEQKLSDFRTELVDLVLQRTNKELVGVGNVKSYKAGVLKVGGEGKLDLEISVPKNAVSIEAREKDFLYHFPDKSEVIMERGSLDEDMNVLGTDGKPYAKLELGKGQSIRVMESGDIHLSEGAKVTFDSNEGKLIFTGKEGGGIAKKIDDSRFLGKNVNLDSRRINTDIPKATTDIYLDDIDHGKFGQYVQIGKDKLVMSGERITSSLRDSSFKKVIGNGDNLRLIVGKEVLTFDGKNTFSSKKEVNTKLVGENGIKIINEQNPNGYLVNNDGSITNAKFPENGRAVLGYDEKSFKTTKASVMQKVEGYDNIKDIGAETMRDMEYPNGEKVRVYYDKNGYAVGEYSFKDESYYKYSGQIKNEIGFVKTEKGKFINDLPSGSEKRYEYDANGKLKKVHFYAKDPEGNLDYNGFYDPKNRAYYRATVQALPPVTPETTLSPPKIVSGVANAAKVAALDSYPDWSGAVEDLAEGGGQSTPSDPLAPEVKRALEPPTNTPLAPGTAPPAPNSPAPAKPPEEVVKALPVYTNSFKLREDKPDDLAGLGINSMSLSSKDDLAFQNLDRNSPSAQKEFVQNLQSAEFKTEIKTIPKTWAGFWSGDVDVDPATLAKGVTDIARVQSNLITDPSLGSEKRKFQSFLGEINSVNKGDTFSLKLEEQRSVYTQHDSSGKVITQAGFSREFGNAYVLAQSAKSGNMLSGFKLSK